MGVPVLERKPVLRKISGQVYCGKGISQTPANHALVSLVRESQTISSTSTDISGNFTLATPLNPEFSYQLIASASCGQSSKSLPGALKNQMTEEIIYLQK